MYNFICPVCKEALIQKDKALSCINNHSFDIAKQGYVNLFMSQQSSKKRHGDDKLMINARKNFLDKGYYECLFEGVYNNIKPYCKNGMNILDAGCGECYYSDNIYKKLNIDGVKSDIIGIDISKDALIIAKKRNENFSLAVSSIFEMPIKSQSIDIVLNFFAPLSVAEYNRVLKNSGILVRVVPTKNHLFGLKSKIYDNPYYNKDTVIELDGFKLVSNTEIEKNIVIDNNDDIINLFKMTPYYYKTSKTDQEKISALKKLETEIGFMILLYKKL